MKPWRIPLYYFKAKPYYLSTALRQVAHSAVLRARAFGDRHRGDDSVLFVLSEPRCGTEFFCDCLDSTGEFLVRSEILNPWVPYGLPPGLCSERFVLGHIAASMRGQLRHVAIKLMLQHLRWRRISIEQIVRRFDKGKYVLLYRQDLLSQYVSNKALIATGQHRISSDSQRRSYRMKVNADDFRQFAENAPVMFGDALTTLRRAGVVHELVQFENLVQDPQGVFDSAVLPLLGMSSRPVRTRTVRQNVKPISESIDNWPEIASLVSQHRYLHFDGNCFSLGNTGTFRE